MPRLQVGPGWGTYWTTDQCFFLTLLFLSLSFSLFPPLSNTYIHVYTYAYIKVYVLLLLISHVSLSGSATEPKRVEKIYFLPYSSLSFSYWIVHIYLLIWNSYLLTTEGLFGWVFFGFWILYVFLWILHLIYYQLFKTALHIVNILAKKSKWEFVSIIKNTN